MGRRSRRVVDGRVDRVRTWLRYGLHQARQSCRPRYFGHLRRASRQRRTSEWRGASARGAIRCRPAGRDVFRPVHWSSAFGCARRVRSARCFDCRESRPRGHPRRRWLRPGPPGDVWRAHGAPRSDRHTLLGIGSRRAAQVGRARCHGRGNRPAPAEVEPSCVDS